MTAKRTARFVLSPIAVLGMALSCQVAWEFGFALRGWTGGVIAVAADLTKSFILIPAPDDGFIERRSARRVFWFLIFMSLICSCGNSLLKFSSHAVQKNVAGAVQAAKETDLAQLRKDKNGLGSFIPTTQDAVDTATRLADDLDKAAKEEEARHGCGSKCQDLQRKEIAARTDLLKAQKDLAATKRANELNAEIKAATPEANNESRMEEAAKSTDPIAEFAGKMFCEDAQSDPTKRSCLAQDVTSLFESILWALIVEVLSSFLPWFVWGHGRPEDNSEGLEDTRTPADPLLQSVQDTPEASREAFFSECVISSDGRIGATPMYDAYCRWSRMRGKTPMSEQAFGTGSPWPKRKTGNVYYLNCSLVDALLPTKLQLRVVS